MTRRHIILLVLATFGVTIAGAQIVANQTVRNERRHVTNPNALRLGGLTRADQLKAVEAWNTQLAERTVGFGGPQPFRLSKPSAAGSARLLEFKVVHLPKFLGADTLYGYKVVVWQDATGVWFRTAVSSHDPKMEDWTVDSVGPVDDTSVSSVWPPQRPGKPSGSGRTDGQLVVLTYPNDVEKLYWQFGDDPNIATFENIGTGHVVVGLSQLRAELDAEGK